MGDGDGMQGQRQTKAAETPPNVKSSHRNIPFATFHCVQQVQIANNVLSNFKV